MVAFANPVAGPIFAKGVAHPLGTFAVTATYQDHIDGNRAPGIDIGDGRCGDPVLAMKAGTVSYIRPGVVGATTSDKASIVRVTHDDGWVTGYAHLSIRIGLVVGQRVPEGYELGTVNKIGATACHLHWGPKDPNGVEVDGWPLLRQNGAVEDDVLQGANPQRIVNRQTTVLADETNFRSSPFVRADNKIAKFAAGALAYPDWAVEGTLVGTSKRWYAFWGLVATGQEFGYMHESVLAPLAPVEQSGHTDADLIKAVQTAGYNAANDVSAQAAITAAKYPKP